MKVILQFDAGDGMECSPATLGFECDSIHKLEASIREAAGRYLNDLDKIENKVAKLYELKRIRMSEIDRRVDAIRRDPYLIRSGKYVLWAGNFVIYRFNGGGMVREYVEPQILTMDEWFATIVETSDSGLH